MSSRELKITITGDASRLRQAANAAKADLEAAAGAARKIDDAVARAEKSTAAEAKSARAVKAELEGAATAAKKNADAAGTSVENVERLRVVARAVKAEASGIADASQQMRTNFAATAASVAQIQSSAAAAAANLAKIAAHTSGQGGASGGPPPLPFGGGTGRMQALGVGLAAAAAATPVLVGLNKQVFGDLRSQDELMLGSAAEMADARERIRTLAGIKGKGFSSDEEVEEVFRMRAETGMSTDAAVKFKEGMLNEGIASIGTTMTSEQFKGYESFAANYLQAKALDPGAFAEASNLAGKLTRWEDYTKPGKGAERAKGNLQSMFDVLNLGSGGIPILVRELGQAAGYLNENEKRGYFQDPAKLALATSMGAQFAPGQAGTYIRQAIRNLSRFEGAQGETLREAKVDPNDDFFAAMGKMKTYLEKTAVKQGVKPTFYLQQHGFTDQEGREAIVNFMTAMDSPAYKQQLALIDAPRTSTKGQSEIEAFRKSREGVALIAQQEAEMRRLRAGMAFEAGLPYAQQAAAAVQAERVEKGADVAGVLSRGGWNFGVQALGYLGYDLPGADEVEARWKQAEMLGAEARRLGVAAPEFSALDYRAEGATWTRMMSEAAENLRQAAAALNKSAPQPASSTQATPTPAPIGAAPSTTGPVQ